MTNLKSGLKTRPLSGEDLEEVINIDARIGGRRRPGFYEKRLAAAIAEPKQFVYAGCELGGRLKGFLFARLLEGEYGIDEPVAAMDAIGVDPGSQGQGLGTALAHYLENVLRHKGIGQVHTQADWRNRNILGFLSDTGFRLAPRHVLEREVSYPSTLPEDDEAEFETDVSGEADFSAPAGQQVGVLARDAVICRSLQQDDQSALVRIDRRISGKKRPRFHARKVAEALDETGIRTSLVAEQDRNIVGFIMARVDYGEFDRTEPVAVMDSIAVDPGYRHLQVGTTLLQRLLGNLATLRMEKVRTEVDMRYLDVLSFLNRNGFEQSQQLAFVRKLR